MSNSRRMAAYVWMLAGIYLFGFVIAATLLNPGDTTGWSGLQRLEFVLQRQPLYQLWMGVLYLLFGLLLVPFSQGLQRTLGRYDPQIMSSATAFGLIWAGLILASGMVANLGLTSVASLSKTSPDDAVTVWRSLGVVQEALGGGIELVAGVWTCLISRAGRGAPGYSVGLRLLGMGVGAAGVLTVVPELRDLAAVFGLGQIIWFAWLGHWLWMRAP
jgi:hypothetical protein